MFCQFLSHSVYWCYLGLPRWLSGKKKKQHPSTNAGDTGSIPALGRSLGKGNGNSSVFAWEIPRTEEPGGLQCVVSQRVRQDLAAEKQQQQQQDLHLRTFFIINWSNRWIFFSWRDARKASIDQHPEFLIFSNSILWIITWSVFQNTADLSLMRCSIAIWQNHCKLHSLEWWGPWSPH